MQIALFSALVLCCIIGSVTCSNDAPQQAVVIPQAKPGPECKLHPAFLERIRKDLLPWAASGISDELARNVSRQFPVDHTNNQNVIRVMIQNGTPYMNAILNRIEGFGFGSEVPGVLLDIWETSQRYRLPNVELAFQGGDEPPAHTFPGSREAKALGRIWSFGHAKSEEHAGEVLIPASGHARCKSDGIDALMSKVAEYEAVPWEQRKQVALGRATGGFCPYWIHQDGGRGFFRDDNGTDRTPPCPRKFLVKLAESHQDVLDIKEPGESTYVPLSKQIQWRYLVSTDGFSVSTKLEKYLMLGSTVLKQHSHRVGYFYDAIKPYQHYMPFFVDNASDILQSVAWLRQHDKEALAMATAGRQFALEHLSRPARLCYWKTLIEEWSKLFRYTPSCSLRKICVPVIDELNYIGHYRPGECPNIHEQIEEVMGGPVPHGKKKGEKYWDVKHHYGHEHWSPHED